MTWIDGREKCKISCVSSGRHAKKEKLNAKNKRWQADGDWLKTKWFMAKSGVFLRSKISKCKFNWIC